MLTTHYAATATFTVRMNVRSPRVRTTARRRARLRRAFIKWRTRSVRVRSSSPSSLPLLPLFFLVATLPATNTASPPPSRPPVSCTHFSHPLTSAAVPLHHRRFIQSFLLSSTPILTLPDRIVSRGVVFLRALHLLLLY